MQKIENKEKWELKGMKLLIDEVILCSQELKTSEIFKGFLQCMEEMDDPMWIEVAKRLGKCIK